MKKVFMAIALSLSLFSIGCYEDTTVSKVSDIDALLTEVDEYLIAVDEGRALQSATDEDKELLVHSITELRRYLIRFKEDRKSTFLLSQIFNEYKTIQSYPLTQADRGAIYNMINNLYSVLLTYQRANNVVVGIYILDTFLSGLGNWNQYSVVGSQIWYATSHGSITYAYITAYENPNTFANEDWLISDEIVFGNFSGIRFSFDNASRIASTTDPLVIKYSFDYPGSGNPNSYTWQNYSGSVSLSDGSWAWVNSGNLDIYKNGNTKVYIALRYYRPDTTSGNSWEVTNMKIEAL